jgi:YVTN family beta-propeller protein
VLSALSGIAQQLIATVPVGGPFAAALAINPVTDKIYVNIANNDLMTVIDGLTLATTNVTVGINPAAIAVNPVTNKIYVSSGAENIVTVIDGQTLSTANVTVGRYPYHMVVDSTRNKIYVGTEDGVYVIDGATNNTTTVPVSGGGLSLDIDTVTNKIYVATNNDTVVIIDGATLTTTSVPVAAAVVAVNSTTNKIYTVAYNGNMMIVIDGATLSTTTVVVGQNPVAIGIDSVTNKTYVANFNDNTVTVVDGATLSTLTVPVEQGPAAVAVDSVTNKIYIANQTANSVTMIDGNTNSTVSLQVGEYPANIAANSTTNTIYASNLESGTVSVIAGAPSSTPPLQLYPVTPCRLVDTRQTGNPIRGGTSQNFIVPQLGGCGIPTSAVAYSLNVTVVPRGPLGYLTIWPTGQVQPYVSTMNSPDGRIKANAAIVPAGYQNAVSVYATNTTNVILDTDGYFTAPAAGTYQFYPLTPCRLVDTRGADGPLGGPHLPAQQARDFPVLTSPCLQGLPNQPQAYSLNVTVVPHPTGQQLGYLTVWPSNEQQPYVSTLNNPTATVVANAAIVPAAPDGDIDAYAYNSTDLVIDINGYFAAPGGTNALSLYPVAPCRVLDTRQNNGQPFIGELTVNVVGSVCAPPSTAQAFVFNATVVPPGSMPYLTLWPDGAPQPYVSTLNAYDGFITSNMAIVPTTNGSIDAYAYALTQLILDISGYFSP